MTTRATIVVLCAALTRLTDQRSGLGSAAGSQVAAAEAEVVDRGGVMMTATANRVMARFASSAAALDCAAAIQRRFAGVEGWAVQAGISAGDAEGAGADWSGACVIEASGLCAAARGGQVLVLDLAVRLAGPVTNHTFAAHEAINLADLVKPVNVLELVWEMPTQRSLTVVLADDSVLLRAGISGLLTNHNFRVVGEAGNAVQLMELVDALRPDLVVVDIRMPPTHTLEGIQATARLKERYPEMGVLILSQHLESRAALSLLEEHRQGIGYLLKDRVADVGEFIAALQSIASGGTALDRDVVARLMGRRRVDDPLEGLSARETEVLSCMAEGLSNQAIGERLTLGVRTVEAHIASIFSKLGLEPEPDGHRRVMAVVAFLRRP